MKAILKATGEIVTVKCRWVTTIGGKDELRFIDPKTGISYTEHQLAILFQEDNNREPNYWTRLEHQAAIGAMQAYIIASHISQFSFCESDMKDCKTIAHALVEKLKESK